MEWRRLFRTKLFPGGPSIAHVTLYTLLFLITGILVLYWGRPKERDSVSGVDLREETLQPNANWPDTKAGDVKTSPRAKTGTAKAEGQSPHQSLPTPSFTSEEVSQNINLTERLLRPDLAEEERAAAIEELAAMDQSIVLDVVMKVLDSASADVREASLDALANIDDQAVNAALLKAMEDENLDVKEKAIDIMEHINSPNILPSLERGLVDRDEDIREQALSILEDMPDVRAVDILIEKGLLSDYSSTRADALDSLGFIAGEDFENYEQAREWWDLNRDTFLFDNDAPGRGFFVHRPKSRVDLPDKENIPKDSESKTAID